MPLKAKIASLKGETRNFPVYVTNKTANDEIMTYSLNPYAAMFIFFIGCINAILWGMIGAGLAFEYLYNHLGG